jgi:hypothetical protein
MSTIVTRAGKGSALTHNEVDANFVNLNTDKLQSGNTAAALTITSATINGGTITGTALNGTLGATTPSTVAATTISASGVSTFSAGSAGAPAITTAGDTNTGIFFPTADTIAFAEGGVESMRLDSSGNLGLGVTPSAWGSSYRAIQLGSFGALETNNGNKYVAVASNHYNNGSGDLYIANGFASRYYTLDGTHVWNTAPSGTAGNAITFTQAMTLDASGNLGIGTAPAASARTTIGMTTGGDYLIRGYNDTASNPYGILIDYVATPNNTGNEFLICRDTRTGTVVGRLYVRSNGGIANYSANNVNLSDERTKKDITDAGSYIDKICAIPVRTFLYKDQTDNELNLGVIAQEVEAVAPELVDVSGFGETPEDGVPLKAIYQTDLQYALMKCIQEQQAMIDELKAKVAALEAA